MNAIMKGNAVSDFFSRRLNKMFPGHFAGAKHDIYADFGFPSEVSFDLAYQMYCRNGIANAAIDKTIGKCWVEAPFLLEAERDGSQSRAQRDETKLEKAIRQKFTELRLWAKLAEADRRSLVGRYAGVILRVADGKRWNEPLERVGGGLDALIEIIPAWEGQLSVSKWDEDERSVSYGLPLEYEYDEQAVGETKRRRKVSIHASRVVVWSADGTLNCRSALEPGFNDLMTLAKIIGAGGEGFWKNARAAPVLTTNPEADMRTMAQIMGVELKDLLDAMNRQVEEWQKGFDKLLMLQGMEPKSISVSLPSPEQFALVALQSFAASFDIPLKILVGSQTGERASTEDAREWAITCNGRRENWITPAALTVVKRLEACAILPPNNEWYIDWNDLTEATQTEKLDLAAKMATINSQVQFQGEIAFTSEEIREVAGYEPLADNELPEMDPENDGEVDPFKKDARDKNDDPKDDA